MNLLPFSGTNPSFSLSAEAHIKGSILNIFFNLQGPLEKLKNLSEASGIHGRKHELWKTTCFEWFIKSKNAPNYWECNMSPAGDWNIYKLSDYRKNLQEELLLETFFLRTERTSEESWTLDATIDLTPLTLPQGKILVNLSAVLENKEGEKSYWSLAHTQKQADFHHPEHFVMEIFKES
jgi:hypothetical protein